ncbi:Ig-like domain-containing protein [Geopsychrobacter electrodiphilus]|uniref:Ig-like domain-containing protein n=1 Tax=Geopsychrobacter electrodiphilus TaxID=225196 RepID=UPI00035F4DB0|nr:Ig-like domain-containing protein [Geopsychrobacter electrodiphilus]
MLIANQSPAENTSAVRRDWSLTADVTDASGISSVALLVNGVSVTPSTTSITDGKRVEYAPPTASGYGDRITIELTATPVTGAAVTYTWRFTTATGLTAATSSPPPNLVVAKDISLTAAEADDQVGGVNVIWLADITHPLIVTEDQAQLVGSVAVNDNCYHKHRRTLLVDRLDVNGDASAALQEGDLVAITIGALGETAQKAQVLAIRQSITPQDGVQYELLVEYYEAV